ncbi:MAG TPA: diacylglycerol kinase family protein [Pseudonocardia sp.]
MSVPVARPVTGAQRIAAVVALLSGGLTVVLAVTVAVARFPSGLGVLACIVLAMAAAWFAVVRRGTPRVTGMAVAAVALAGAGALLFRNNGWGFLIGLAIGVAIWHAAARAAFRVHLRLPAAEPPQRPVLFINPWSGGGKAAKVGLAEHASRRGIRTVELHRGDDLKQLVSDAVAAGADGLAAAGGDGTQAVVATAAAEHDLPYACIPAGTRNHFALDLGVDREDVVGALDAFVDGGEHLVDLGEVNGQVFVNNVSMGLYAEAVQSDGYRNAKIRTLLDTVPAVFSPTGSELDLRWVAPDGVAHTSAATILVSNNAYRFGHAVGSGTRPRIDGGSLGVAVVPARGENGGGRHAAASPLRQWTTAQFEVNSANPVPLGIDGEAVVLEPPVYFRIRPGTLRVRISPRHPGASPSAMEPDRLGDSLRALAAIAAGRLPPARALAS